MQEQVLKQQVYLLGENLVQVLQQQQKNGMVQVLQKQKQ
jgi:hypothetical protein